MFTKIRTTSSVFKFDHNYWQILELKNRILVCERRVPLDKWDAPLDEFERMWRRNTRCMCFNPKYIEAIWETEK